MPRVGEKRPDGKVWAGDKFGWQSPQTVWKQQQPGSRTGETRTLPGLGTKVWTGSDFGWQSQATIDKNKQGAKPESSKPKPKPEPDKPKAKPEPTPAPAKPKPEPAKPAPAPAPEASRPAPTRPAPAPVRQPAPQASPVAKYMAAAAAARKSGDPAQMAAVRDQGLAIWRDKYKDTLAKKVSPTGQQLGTGQSVMSKQAAELRALRPVKTPEAPVNTSTTTTAAPAPQPTVKTDTAAQRAQEAQKPIPLEVKPFKTTKLEKSNVKKTSTGTLAASYEYDAYDLVLEYLLSEGHADTVEEAHYVMLQMDAEHIQNIVEAPGEWFGGLRDRARASRDAQIRAMQPKVSPAGPSVTSPFAKPASRDDSGKLTTYGAGGGAEAERRGKTRDEVMRQGAKNLENKKPVNQGPDFGR